MKEIIGFALKNHTGSWFFDEQTLTLLVILVPAFLAVGVISLWCSRRTKSPVAPATIAMAAAYVANGLFCVIGFRNEDQASGWRLTIVACAGIAVDGVKVALSARTSGMSPG